MKIVQNMNLNVRGIIDLQKYDANLDYIKSQYIYTLRTIDGYLLYNSLTKEMLLIEEMSGFYPTQELVQKWWFFPKSFNQYEFCVSMKKKYKEQIEGKFEGRNSFTILTTMACNAKCTYCYEKNYANKIPMSDTVALNAAKYIEKVRNPRSIVKLSWFGGEPTTNTHPIKIICEYLSEHGIDYRSSMISNGYLFDTFNMNEIKTLWKLQHVQITLDGIFDDYNNVKNYSNGDEKAFNRVVKNIKTLVDNEITVSIRLNLTDKNFEQLQSVAEYLSVEMKDIGRVGIYTYPIFDQDITVLPKVFENWLKLTKILTMAGLNTNTGSGFWDSVRTSQCMADSDGDTCITPIGNLTPCEHYSNENIVGNIYEGVINNETKEKFSKLSSDIEACKTCPYKPMCYRIEACPDNPPCIKEYRDYLTWTVEKGMFLQYKNHQSKEKTGASICYADVKEPENVIYLQNK